MVSPICIASRMARTSSVLWTSIPLTWVRMSPVRTPFAAASLYCLIRLLLNILKDRVFIAANVTYIRLVSLFCYAVAAITLVTGVGYFPLLIICFVTGTVGTLLLVMKNLLRGAVELREENELTI